VSLGFAVVIIAPHCGVRPGFFRIKVKEPARTERFSSARSPFSTTCALASAKADDIGLTGSKVKQNGADLILAREVVKGDMTLVLRDGKATLYGAGTADLGWCAIRSALIDPQ
jgi:hypothetical protein